MTFSYTGAEQDWVVPSGVTHVTVTADGAEGGVGYLGPSDGGGQGGTTTATIAVTPGETLAVFVGGQGGDSSSCTPGAGGFNGGGAGGTCGGGGGGGASDVRQGGAGLADRVVVAGGGGGGGYYQPPGAGGAGGGSSGASGGTFGGGGGSQSAGGAGGSASGANTGGGGALGVGGTGAGGAWGGGGGGGGYYGGGAGLGESFPSPKSGSGGGGSSYADPSATGVTLTQGGHGGDGQVVFSYRPASTTAVASSENPSSLGDTLTLTATVTGAGPTGTVDFRDGGVSIAGCSAAALSGGAATCVTTPASAGSHSISAVYSGDTDNDTSTSAALVQTVNALAPDAPTGVTATPGDRQATVSWSAPASDGGAAITAYTVTASPGGRTCTWTSGPLSCIVAGLTDGSRYAFTVTATNSAGTGAASASSNEVTPQAAAPPPPPAPSTPGAPGGVSAVAGDGQATVACTAPADSGGATITTYTAIASPGGARSSAASCPITITGLTDGVAYTFTVVATNRTGAGPASIASTAVTPRDANPPTPLVALAGRFVGGALVLTWNASTDNVAVDHYQVYLDGTPILRVAGALTHASVRAIHPRGRSVYTVRAVDAAGNRSDTRGSVAVQSVGRPAGIPKRIPVWAWRLLAWHESGGHGTSPKRPRPLPGWYTAWAGWRTHPFALAR